MLGFVYVTTAPDALLLTTDLFQPDTELFWLFMPAEETGKTATTRKKCISIPMCEHLCVCVPKTLSKDERAFSESAFVGIIHYLIYKLCSVWVF